MGYLAASWKCIKVQIFAFCPTLVYSLHFLAVYNFYKIHSKGLEFILKGKLGNNIFLCNCCLFKLFNLRLFFYASFVRARTGIKDKIILEIYNRVMFASTMQGCSNIRCITSKSHHISLKCIQSKLIIDLYVYQSSSI